MGGGASRPTFPAYVAARSRYSRSELGTITKGFEDCAGKSSLSMEEFQSKFPDAGAAYSRLLFLALRNGKVLGVDVLQLI